MGFFETLVRRLPGGRRSPAAGRPPSDGPCHSALTAADPCFAGSPSALVSSAAAGRRRRPWRSWPLWPSRSGAAVGSLAAGHAPCGACGPIPARPSWGRPGESARRYGGGCCGQPVRRGGLTAAIASVFRMGRKRVRLPAALPGGAVDLLWQRPSVPAGVDRVVRSCRADAHGGIAGVNCRKPAWGWAWRYTAAT